MAWLYVPAGEGLNLGCPSPSETPTAPSVSLNGKSTQPQSWSRAWKKGGYIRLLSGMTLRPSMADAGVAAWISSLRDSRVSPSAQPGSDRPTTIADTSGRTSGGLSTGRDRLSSFWKTSEPLFQLDSGTGDRRTWWSETSWSDWVTELRRRSSAHRMSGHHISESASSSWPTIAARDYRTPNRNGNQVDQLPNFVDQWATPVTVTGGPAGQGPNGTSRDRDLQREAAQWATPMAADSENAGGAYYGRTLASDTKAWPTPSVLQQEESVESWTARRAREKAKGTNGNGFGEPLDMLAQRFHLDREIDTPGPPSLPSAPNLHRLWQAPQAFRDTGETLSEWRDRNARKKAENENLGSLQLSLATQARGDHRKMRLNPLFVEWLMGWPEHWSTARNGSDSSATAWSHWLRRSRSELARIHSALR
jgi:hypothetical protein